MPELVELNFSVASATANGADAQNLVVKLLCERDNALSVESDILKNFENNNVSEPEVCALMARAVRPDDRCVDGGANVGYFSIILSQLVGARGEVFACEPDPFNVIKLRNNLRENACSNVSVLPHPLWAARVVKQFHVCEHNGWGSLFNGLNYGEARTKPVDGVQTLTLDDIAPPLRLIKLDVEGSELPALCGGGRHIARGENQCPFVVCELNEPLLARLQIDQYVLFNLMRAHGYDVFVLHAGSPPQLVPPAAAVVSQVGLCNVLFSTLGAVRALP